MRDDRFNNNFIELMAGTNNRLQPAYMEAVNAVDKSETKLVDYVHRFVESISKVRKKDSKITASAGNIKKYAGYDSITTMIDYLKKEMKSDSRLKDVITVMNALETNQPLYTDAYENKMDLIIMEYEVCVDMVSNTLTLMVADSIKITDTNDKLEVKCDPKSKSPSSIYKVMSELAKEVSNPKHKNYLENMLKVNDAVKKNKVHTESYMVEASHGNKDRLNESIELYDLYDLYSENVVADTIEAIDMVIGGVINIGFLSADILRMLKKSLFGIIPLIRTCLYIKYKKRADTIEVLEQQAALITQNIERLKNRKNIDPKEKARIIKEQQAIVKAYQKKAANLRAEFAEAEKVASREMNYENKIMSNSTSTKSSNTTANNRDDDFILENGQSIINIFDK